MFVRKIKHPNGTVYVQVVSKAQGKYQVVKSFGGAKSPHELLVLESKARHWIVIQQGIQELDFTNYRHEAERVLSNITNHKLVGIELLLGKIFDEIGFNHIEDPYFRHLVLYRLAFPASKLKTTAFLYRFAQIDWSADQLYRYLDKLYSNQKETVQNISYAHTSKVLGHDVKVVFYDVTTLYFEIDREDELRKTGFSKEGKHQNPQIVLGLLVSKGAYPLAYEIFEGNKFEGHTMLPVLDHFKKKYQLGSLTVVADSGLLSKANMDALAARGYTFILGARIKAESEQVRQKILSLQMGNGDSVVIDKGALKLIITYSAQRAKKDAHNRAKGLRKLEKSIKSGKLTKASINKRGYNKYLKLKGKIDVAIDYHTYEQDAKWDGLKGYITNSKLPKQEIIDNYMQLWQIEKAFRIAKSDIKIRPVFHRLPRRIEAHICIAFVAYKIYKELERQLDVMKAQISPDKAIAIAINIYELEVTIPNSDRTIKRIMLLSDEQKMLAELFNFPFY